MSGWVQNDLIFVVCFSVQGHFDIWQRRLFLHQDPLWVWEGGSSEPSFHQRRDLQSDGHTLWWQTGQLAGNPLWQGQPAAGERHHPQQEQVCAGAVVVLVMYAGLSICKIYEHNMCASVLFLALEHLATTESFDELYRPSCSMENDELMKKLELFIRRDAD